MTWKASRRRPFRHMNALYDAAVRLAGDQATAQDLTQETYLRALRSFDTFRQGNAWAWLLRIQYNLFCTQYRRGRRMPLVWLDEGETDPRSTCPAPTPARRSRPSASWTGRRSGGPSRACPRTSASP